MINRLIRNCNVLIFNGDTPEVVLNQDIAIEKSLIKEIGKSGLLEVDKKTEIVDALPHGWDLIHPIPAARIS